MIGDVDYPLLAESDRLASIAGCQAKKFANCYKGPDPPKADCHFRHMTILEQHYCKKYPTNDIYALESWWIMLRTSSSQLADADQ